MTRSLTKHQVILWGGSQDHGQVRQNQTRQQKPEDAHGQQEGPGATTRRCRTKGWAKILALGKTPVMRNKPEHPKPEVCSTVLARRSTEKPWTSSRTAPVTWGVGKNTSQVLGPVLSCRALWVPQWSGPWLKPSSGCWVCLLTDDASPQRGRKFIVVGYRSEDE